MTNVKVGAGQRNPSHDLSLSDGVQTWGLRLDGGPRAIQGIPETPSTLKRPWAQNAAPMRDGARIGDHKGRPYEGRLDD